jgi:hypothetical protein
MCQSMTYCTVKNSCVGACFCTWLILYTYSFIYFHPILTAETITKNLMNESKRDCIKYSTGISLVFLIKNTFPRKISCNNVAPFKLPQLCKKHYWQFIAWNLSQNESLYIHLCLMLKFYTFVNKDIEPN